MGLTRISPWGPPLSAALVKAYPSILPLWHQPREQFSRAELTLSEGILARRTILIKSLTRLARRWLSCGGGCMKGRRRSNCICSVHSHTERASSRPRGAQGTRGGHGAHTAGTGHTRQARGTHRRHRHPTPRASWRTGWNWLPQVCNC